MKDDAMNAIGAALKSFDTRRILVLGDIMLDQYLWGDVKRISPEAPVPIIEVKSEEYRLGGAANVALNLAALGAKVELVGVCGRDSHARTLIRLLKKEGLNTNGIFADSDRPTTLKTRIGAVSQQIVRLDRESTEELKAVLTEGILRYISDLLPTCDALIIEDYDKGMLGRDMIARVLELCTKYNVPVAVDPKQKNFEYYQKVDIFKPNFGELQAYLNRKLSTDEEFYSSAVYLMSKMQLKYLVVTRGSKGMYVFGRDMQPKHLPSFAKEVFDVSGAGDTVISALCLAFLHRQHIEEAVLIANHAAAVVVAKHGTATVNQKEIWESLNDVN